MNKIEMHVHDDFLMSGEEKVRKQIDIACEAYWEPRSETFSTTSHKVHERLSICRAGPRPMMFGTLFAQ